MIKWFNYYDMKGIVQYMQRYVNFEEVIKEHNLVEEDKNNLIGIILLLHNEKKRVSQLAQQLELRNMKVKYYLDILEKENIVKKENMEEMGVKNLQYSLVRSEILGTIDGSNEVMRKIQAKRLGIYLEEQILNLCEQDLNLISLAEISIRYEDVQEVSNKLNEIYAFLVKKEQEALDKAENSDEKIINYSLLTSFVASRGNAN